MVDFKLRDKALKIMMLKRILEPGEEKWKVIPMYYYDKAGYNSLLLNVHMLPSEYVNGQMYMPLYYKQLIVSLNSCKHNMKSTLSTARGVREQIIWGNQWIKYKGKPLWFEKWIKSNIIFVNDLYDSNGNFDVETIFQQVGDKTDIFSEMFKIKNAIPDDWKRIVLQDPCKILVKLPSKTDIVFLREGQLLYLKDLDASGEVYKILVDINKKPPSTKAYWNTVFNDKNIVWKSVYIEKLYNVTEQKIVAFNSKILNNILATPYKLSKWRIIDSSVCYLCFSTGNLEHMMLRCPYFEDYYTTVLYVLDQQGYKNVKTDLYTLLCGHKPGTAVYKPINLLLNIIFFSVYKCWVQININRMYKNPVKVLFNEMNIRCKTNTYNNFLFLQYTEKLKHFL
jgi:hypothetical protein